MIIFGSVRFFLKNNQIEICFKKNQNRFGSVFFDLAWFFSCLTRFFCFGLVFSVISDDLCEQELEENGANNLFIFFLKIKHLLAY
jgi:hypothetical protein